MAQKSQIFVNTRDLRQIDASDSNWPDQLSAEPVSSFRVLLNNFNVSCALNRKNTEGPLYVMLHGVIKRATDQPMACFVRREWDKLFNGPILCISDPQTEGVFSTEKPRAGMYIGTSSNDMVPVVNAIIDGVCRHLQINPSDCVIVGSGVGGASAILIGGRRLHGGNVLAMNSFLIPKKYPQALSESLVKSLNQGVESSKSLLTEAPERIQPFHQIVTAVKQNYPVRFFLAQAKNQTVTLNHHFERLWTRFGTDPNGGVNESGHLMSFLYQAREEDAKESEESIKKILAVATDFFAGKTGGPLRAGGLAIRESIRFGGLGKLVRLDVAD